VLSKAKTVKAGHSVNKKKKTKVLVKKKTNRTKVLVKKKTKKTNIAKKEPDANKG